MIFPIFCLFCRKCMYLSSYHSTFHIRFCRTTCMCIALVPARISGILFFFSFSSSQCIQLCWMRSFFFTFLEKKWMGPRRFEFRTQIVLSGWKLSDPNKAPSSSDSQATLRPLKEGKNWFLFLNLCKIWLYSWISIDIYIERDYL